MMDQPAGSRCWFYQNLHKEHIRGAFDSDKSAVKEMAILRASNNTTIYIDTPDLFFFGLVASQELIAYWKERVG